jgi:hypothetical protein
MSHLILQAFQFAKFSYYKYFDFLKDLSTLQTVGSCFIPPVSGSAWAFCMKISLDLGSFLAESTECFPPPLLFSQQRIFLDQHLYSSSIQRVPKLGKESYVT